MTKDLTLMQAAIQKMHWHEARQKALASNIANADTPGYKPQDIAAIDFKDLLGSSASSLPMQSAGIATTNAHHMTGPGATAGSADPKTVKQKNPYETSPTGNSVVLEEQLLKMNQNFTDHRLTTTIYQKNTDMLKSAIKSQ